MNRSKKLSLVLALSGLVSIMAAIVMLQVAPVAAQDGPLVPWPADYRYWFHVGSKSIRPEGAAAASSTIRWIPFMPTPLP
jgi:hypothetical protein